MFWVGGNQSFLMGAMLLEERRAPLSIGGRYELRTFQSIYEAKGSSGSMEARVADVPGDLRDISDET